MQRFPAIEAILGCRIEDASAEAIARFVEAASEEADQLDFKAILYEKTDEKREELAKDISAFANHIGGVLVLGVTDEKGRANGIHPVDISDAEQRRIRSVIQSRVQPSLDVVIKAVPEVNGALTGFLLVIVPRSPSAPHAVVELNGPGLRYWIRSGSQTRSLSEAELAGRYRERFALAIERRQRLDEVIQDGVALLNREVPAWCAMALAPSAPGAMEMRLRIDSELGQWAQSLRPLGAWRPVAQMVNWRVGARRVEITGEYEPTKRTATYSAAQLHSDGSGFAALAFSTGLRDLGKDMGIDDSGITFRAVALLDMLARHAVENCGVYGEAIVKIALFGRGADPTGEPSAGLTADWQHQLANARISGTTSVQLPTPWETSTINLDVALRNKSDLLVSARLVTNYLFQCFGLAETLQVADDGTIRIGHVGPTERPSLEVWCESEGVPVSKEKLI